MILSRNYEAFFNPKFMKLISIHHSEYYKLIGFCHLKPKNILIYKIDLHLIFSYSLVELILVGNFENDLYTRHYNPWFVYFSPQYWRPFLCFQGVFLGKLCPYVWLVSKSGLWSRAGYGGTHTVVNFKREFLRLWQAVRSSSN